MCFTTRNSVEKPINIENILINSKIITSPKNIQTNRENRIIVEYFSVNSTTNPSIKPNIKDKLVINKLENISSIKKPIIKFSELKSKLLKSKRGESSKDEFQFRNLILKDFLPKVNKNILL